MRGNDRPGTEKAFLSKYILFFLQPDVRNNGHQQLKEGKYHQQVNSGVFNGTIAAMAGSNQDVVTYSPGHIEPRKKKINPFCPDPGQKKHAECNTAHGSIHQSGLTKTGTCRVKTGNRDTKMRNADPGQETGDYGDNGRDGARLVGVLHFGARYGTAAILPATS